MQALNNLETALINPFVTSDEAVNPSLDAALQNVYGNLQEESRLQKARRIMGRLVAETSDEELDIYVTELEYLITSWLDEFECQVYEGLTLKQLLQE
jgi:hypothetical protein